MVFEKKTYKLKFSIYPPNNDFSIFVLNGILFYSNSLPFESALRIAKNFKGGSYGPPKIIQKLIFFNFWGADNFPPSNFSANLRALA